jgi:hypothetical protein
LKQQLPNRLGFTVNEQVEHLAAAFRIGIRLYKPGKE